MRMRKSFAAMMALVLLLSSILPGIRPASPQIASAHAPPPPTPPAPTPPPAGLDVAAQSLPTPLSPDSLPPEVEEARARQAIEAVLGKTLRYWGPRYQVAPVEVTVEGEWAYGIAHWRSQARTLEEPIHILAHRLPDGAWQALMPSTDGLYLQWVEAVPESLVPPDEKSKLRAQAAEADASRRPLVAQEWRVYSNERLRFSILYPDGWFVREVERSPDAGVLIDFTPVPVREPGQVVPSLWIEVISKPVTLGLDDWIEAYALKGLIAQIRSSVTVRSYQLGGRQGFEITGLPGVHRNLQYFFATPERVYRITISPYEPETPDFENMLPDVQRLRDVMLPSLDIGD